MKSNDCCRLMELSGAAVLSEGEIVYDLTYKFCERFLRRGDRTIDQMIQAARSGKQNIIEGSKASARRRRWNSN